MGSSIDFYRMGRSAMKKSDKQKKDTYINLDKSGQESDSDINSV